MVEVTLEDVVVRVLVPAEGEELPRLANERLRVVLLKERDGERRLPIWVGAPEGNALALHLGSEAPLRPLTVAELPPSDVTREPVRSASKGAAKKSLITQARFNTMRTAP